MKKTISIFLLSIMLICTVSTKVSAANKALQINAKFPKGDNGAGFYIDLETKKGMVALNNRSCFSYDLYLPQSLISKNKDNVFIDNSMIFSNPDDQYGGVLGARYSIGITNVNGKIKTYGWDENNDKHRKISNYVKVKKWNTWYKISVRNMPAEPTVTETYSVGAPEDNKYYEDLDLQTILFTEGQKYVGCIYMDNVTIVSGSTLKSKFNNLKDFKHVSGYDLKYGKNYKAKIANLPSK
ncbi:hypothetical protein [Butyrivibrio sp. MB2005]|uniref:hypothetical protein n=1 Tax=Butyrivibrio sp. MB2005 TaxID=1280678 RepID=UPI00042552E8|nr:hypothetical protein [Butyrivibrio sp. MB2005]